MHLLASRDKVEHHLVRFAPYAQDVIFQLGKQHHSSVCAFSTLVNRAFSSAVQTWPAGWSFVLSAKQNHFQQTSSQTPATNEEPSE
jgi:hypothetical protein